MMLQHLRDRISHWTQQIQRQPNSSKAYIQRGMARFMAAEIEGAIADFDQAEQLDPTVTPYLWQRGLAYYYAERYEEGARQFEQDLAVNGADVEETAWWCLCAAQLGGMEAARSQVYGPEPQPVRDRRPIMTPIHQMFTGQIGPADLLNASQTLGKTGQFYAHLYAGLYGEVTRTAGLELIHRAANNFRLDDYMWHLARVHCQLRSPG
nr:hypothetical protein [Spirulina major]